MTEKSTEELARSELPHQVDVQWAVQAESWMPGNADICRWACEALRNLGGDGQPAEVCVRIVSESEIKGLNRDYRDVNKVTNVLAFPQSIELDVGANLLGDIVICAPVVVSEAQTQVKEPHAHFAHLIIHGMLHLLGYDHVEMAAVPSTATAAPATASAASVAAARATCRGSRCIVFPVH